MGIAQAAFDSNGGEPLTDLRFIIARASDADAAPTREFLGYVADDSSVLRLTILDFHRGVKSKCEWIWRFTMYPPGQAEQDANDALARSMQLFIASFFDGTVTWSPAVAMAT